MYSIFSSRFVKSIKRNIAPKGILSRFFLIIIIPTLIGQFFALHLFYERHWYNVSHHTSAFIVAEIESLLKEPFYKHKNKQRSYINLSYIYLNALPGARENNQIQENDTQEELQIFKKSLNKKLKFPHEVFIDKNGKIVVNIYLDKELLKITLPSKILLNPTTYIFVLWVIFLTILLLSVSLIFLKNQIKSILDLTSAAEKYGRGENMDHFRPAGAKEIRRAGLAFIKMKDRIERQTTRRTQMLAMISHDLKTPLTRMKLQVELMNDSDEKEELNHDIDSMRYMISSYLDFARGEGGESFIETSLNQWVQDYINSFWASAKIQSNLKKQKIEVKIKPHSFTRALDNIISNATKHASKVKISVYKYKEEAIIDIEDNGKGIDETERKLVFKPFYRGNKARTPGLSGSVGLGLAITKEIIIGHYGTIELQRSKTLKGLLARIKLPLATAEK